MIAAEHRLRQAARRAARARRSVRITSPPVTSDASGVRAPAASFSELADRLVETGIPWKTPAADVRHALRDRLLVDVDAVAVAGGERARVAGRLREADQEQPERGDEDRRVVLLEDVDAGQRRRGQAARHVADERDAVRAEVEQPRREQPADDEHERARARRREEAQAEDHRERQRAPTSSVVQLMSPSAADPRRELAPGVVAASRRAGQLRQLADRRRRPRRRRGSR